MRIAEHGSDVLLATGRVARIRPLRADDHDRLRALFERVSDESLYLRFFTGGRRSAQSYLATVFSSSYEGYALVATCEDDVVALGEFVPCGPATAEVSFLVDDAHQHLGLGTLLLEHLAAAALARGMHRFTATVLPANVQMLQVFRDAGFTVRQRVEPGEIEIEIELEVSPELLARIDERDRAADAASVARLLRPRAVAVVGAGRDPDSVGRRVLRNLLAAGFTGAVYPVNPHAAELDGLRVYPDVTALPEGVDLAVVATPARAVLDVARGCAKRGVHALVVVSAGFAEVSKDGASQETELREIARQAGMRLVGPNCLGVLNTNPTINLNATFVPGVAPPRGRIAIASQSGAIGAAIITQARRLGIGVSSFVSLGNKTDVSGNDLLLYWEKDPDTDVIALYLESFGNPRKFARIARRISRIKPIVVVKAGRTAAGTRAASSHTAAVASPDVAVDALLRASGVMRATRLSDMLGVARLLARQRPPAGRRVAIVANSGGPGAMAADACEAAGLTVPELSAGTAAALRAQLGPTAAVTNPVDLTAEGTPERYATALRLALADPAVDAVIVLYTPPFGGGVAATSRAIADAATGASKPVLACVLGSDEPVGELPGYPYPEDAVAALALAASYAEARHREDGQPPTLHGIEVGRARTLVARALESGGGWLDPAAAARLLACYGIGSVESVGVDGPQTAAEAAALVGFPVVLKAVGPLHKSDVGGVRLGLQTPEEVGAAYRQMADTLGDAMRGAVVQPMVRDGVEVIVGAVEQAAFGPLVMLGMGGVTTELLGDRVFNLAPLSRTQAAEMVRGLRCAPLLFGYRGRPAVDVAALEELLVRVGRLADDLPEVAELDLNPVIVSAHHAAVVDVRIRVAPRPAPPSPLIRQLRR